jgi:hypothetical protein
MLSKNCKRRAVRVCGFAALAVLGLGTMSWPGEVMAWTGQPLALQLHLSFRAHHGCNVLSRVAALYASTHGKLVQNCVQKSSNDQPFE